MTENSYELLYMYRQGSEEAAVYLYKAYKGLGIHIVREWINSYSAYRTYQDDLILEAEHMIFQAASCYREDAGVKFSTFLAVVMKRRVQYISRGLTRHSSWINGYAVLSLEDCNPDYDAVADWRGCSHPENDPAYHVRYQEAKDRLDRAMASLNVKERQALYCAIGRMSYDEASRYLQISRKAFDGRLQRARKKVRSAVMNSAMDD